MRDCVVDDDHPVGMFATWFNADNPELVVCDHHKKQYDLDSVYFDDTWLPFLRDVSVEKHHPQYNCKQLCGGDQ